MLIKLTILGTGSSNPVLERNPTSHHLQIGSNGILIDCGEGTQSQLLKYKIKIAKINYIFISHLHGDHYFGLIGLLSTMNMLGRKSDLHLFGPQDLIDILNLQLKASFTNLDYNLIFTATTDSYTQYQLENTPLQISTFPLQHRIPCTGFLLGLKNINDYSFVPKYAFCSDTIYDESLIEYISGVEKLYHESTFLDILENRARDTFHSTASQAGQIAQLANVGQLLLGHFSSRYSKADQHLLEAKSKFANTVTLTEGDVFEF
ncbi:MAG: ribonuclease Z [Pseudarcicella sp.]|nr:ribonuclease Z [Pseudarcicella sp.]MBP6410700.1 ribonuclease Z [Pseudarcicella sp.]